MTLLDLIRSRIEARELVRNEVLDCIDEPHRTIVRLRLFFKDLLRDGKPLTS